MTTSFRGGCDRRCFIRAGCGTAAWAAAPMLLPFEPLPAAAAEAASTSEISAVVRAPTLFAGIRRPITERAELEPRVKELDAACAGSIAGPLTHIFRFDTPVEGYDSEIGYPVSAPVEVGSITTHTLREMHFYSRVHDGPMDTLRVTRSSLYDYMNTTGLSPELELVEVFPEHRMGEPPGGPVQVMASFLAWPEVYRAQLERVLGREAAAAVWLGGEALTPHTPVDPRCTWVGESIDCLKACSTPDQQFDILSRVALVRPQEDILPYKAIYEKTGDITAVFRAQEEKLSQTRTGGFIDPPRCSGSILHTSKVPYNREAYDAASTPRERRRAFCFCNLIREADEPRVDPIFCYRAAGWARQFWEPILGVEFTSCTITASILKGDGFCAWDYRLPESFRCSEPSSA
jgi:hypothetical protein